MKIRIIKCKNNITRNNLRTSITYHFGKLKEQYAKGNKQCFLSIYSKVFSNKLELINEVPKVVINITDSTEIDTYFWLLAEKTLNNSKGSSGSKPGRIHLFIDLATEQEYKHFLKNPFNQ